MEQVLRMGCRGVMRAEWDWREGKGLQVELRRGDEEGGGRVGRGEGRGDSR